MSVIDRFDLLYLGDEFIHQISLDISKQTCRFTLSGASVHKFPIKAFDYEVTYQPANINFMAVKSVNLPDYCLNLQIVEYEINKTTHNGFYNFSFTMTGGWSNDNFMRTIEIIAKDFSLSNAASFAAH